MASRKKSRGNKTGTSGSTRSGGYSSTGSSGSSQRGRRPYDTGMVPGYDPNQPSTVGTTTYGGYSTKDTSHGVHVGAGANAMTGGGNFLDFLNGFINSGNGGHADEVWNLIYQTLFQYALTQDQRDYDWQLQQDQRKYDWSMLQDQRLYTNPTNELARLMGSGISRDAAIQMMSGSAGNIAAGSGGTPFSTGAVSAPSVNTPGTLDLQRGLGIANTVLNGVTTLTNCGISIAEAVPQVQMMQNQAYMSNEQLTAYQSVQQAYSILEAYGNTNEADTFGNVDNAVKAVQELADAGVVAAQNFIDQGGDKALLRTAPISSPMIHQLYRNERASSDYDKSYSQQLRQAIASANLTELSFEDLSADIQNKFAEFEKIMADTEFVEANTALVEYSKNLMIAQAKDLEAHANLLEQEGKTQQAQRLLYRAQKLRTDAETTSINLANSVESSFLEGNITLSNGQTMTGRELLTDKRLREIKGYTEILTRTQNPEYWESVAQEMLSDPKRATALNLLLTWHDTAALEANKDNPTAKIAAGLEACGFREYIEAIQGGYIDAKGFPIQIGPDGHALLEGYTSGIPQEEEPSIWQRGIDAAKRWKKRHTKPSSH